MLTCITCAKQRMEEDEEGAGGTPIQKEAVKSLSDQIKDMKLKFSGAYKQCKPCTGFSTCNKGEQPYPDFDAISEGVSYSTPAWDFTRIGLHTTTGSNLRFSRASGVDQTPSGSGPVSAQSGVVVMEEECEPKEWVAQVEPGVQITFLSLPHGGNDLKRIRFSREMFNKWQAQRWWGENYDRILELYNVQRFNEQTLTPTRSEDGRDSSCSRFESTRGSPMMIPSQNKDGTPRNYYKSYAAASSAYNHGVPKAGVRVPPSVDASRTTTSSRDDVSVSASNAGDMEMDWIEQDEPGVYITIRQLADGTRELRRIRFSRERFGEAHAKLWLEANKERIQAQYL